MNEFDLIHQLIPGLATNQHLAVGAGHDCAVLDVGIPEKFLLFKTDAVVEGVHFTKETPARKIGRKALARNLSDIAAMAGSPISALVTLALPKDYSPDYVFELYEGINELAREYHLSIAGGETTLNPERILISISLIGTVPRLHLVTRGGAQVGDAIFVTGELGGSLSGKHLDFTPRLREAAWLTQRFKVHAMMDLSDGLAGDLRHILRQSKVGAELLSSAIPISRAAKLKAKAESSAKTPLLAALTDGEDFELLFTGPSRSAVPLLDAWKQQFSDLRLSCIGRITAEAGLRLRDKDGIRDLGLHGYTHFEKS